MGGTTVSSNLASATNQLNYMSRSTKLSEIEAGLYVAIVSESKQSGNDVTVRFTTHDGRNHDKVYDYKKEPFLKLCYALGTIKDDVVFDSEQVVGSRLWIAVKEIRDKGVKTFDVFDTLPYSEFTPQMAGNPLVGDIAPPFIEIVNPGSKGMSPQEKQNFINSQKTVLKDDFDEI